MELYDRWIEVYSDLESVGKLEVLDHPPTIKGFVTKLPGKAICDRYIAMVKELKEKKESDLSIVKKFMKAESNTRNSRRSSSDPRDQVRTQKPRVDASVVTRWGTNNLSVQINHLEDPRGTMGLSRSLPSDVQLAGTSIQIPTPMGRCSTRIVCLCVKHFATSHSRKRPA